MPRRKRQSARREVNGLDLLNAYVAAETFGCSGIPKELRDLVELHDVFERVGSREGSWAHEAFVAGSPRPCETKDPYEDPFDESLSTLECGASCLFAWRSANG